MTSHATIEFTVEPFVPASPGPHVMASIEAARSRLTSVEVGPFGTTGQGDQGAVAEAAQAVVQAALSNGASRVSLQVTAESISETTRAGGTR